ncbi:MAG: hypothetical protein JSU92_12200 [Deltaproteobacteria bacterium]|nr:MAG: hypothetical protein JSU92_12200 [Deltaproteobacteria bacterium]
MKKNSLTGVIFIILCLLLTGCSNSEYPQSQNPHLVLISGDNQEGAIGNPLPEPLRVKAQNNGESLSDVEVSFVIAEGDAVLSAQKILTDSTGIAEVTLLLGEILGGWTSRPIRAR